VQTLSSSLAQRWFSTTQARPVCLPWVLHMAAQPRPRSSLRLKSERQRRRRLPEELAGTIVVAPSTRKPRQKAASVNASLRDASLSPQRHKKAIELAYVEGEQFRKLRNLKEPLAG